MSEYLSADRLEMQLQQPHIELTEAQRMLLSVKQEQQEMSAEQGHLISLGALRGDTPPEHWNGTISLASRLESGELNRGQVDAAHAKLPRFFTKAKIGAPKRCGDGRTIEGFDPLDSEWQARGLGVQIFGGTGGDATGIRLAKGYADGATFAGDVETTAKDHKSDFAPGDHTDSNAEGEKTGCGAIDGQIRKNEIYINPEQSQTLQTILTFVYDKAELPLPLDLFRKLKQNAQSVNDRATEYFADKHLALGAIEEQSPEGIEPLTGKHKETSLTLNFVEGTTFDRDNYNTETGGETQNFNVDVWAIIKEHGEDAAYVLADMIATALDLTDGTIEVFARVSSEQTEQLEAVA